MCLDRGRGTKRKKEDGTCSVAAKLREIAFIEHQLFFHQKFIRRLLCARLCASWYVSKT